MMLCFLRHAEAEDSAASDHERKLTPKGLEQAAKAGKFLARAGILPDLIITSPVVRAKQTAAIVSHLLGVDLVEARWLSCGMEPKDCLSGISAFSSKESILLVGHEPDFSETIAALIGLSDPSALKIRKASLVVIDLAGLNPGCGQLQFLIPARLLL